VILLEANAVDEHDIEAHEISNNDFGCGSGLIDGSGPAFSRKFGCGNGILNGNGPVYNILPIHFEQIVINASLTITYKEKES
jgi:hypothetical protein